MTDEDLRKAEKTLVSAHKRWDTARETRNRLIRQALAEGWTHARIAEATGLSRGRISQFTAEGATTPAEKPAGASRKRGYRGQPGPNVENIRSSAQTKRSVQPVPKRTR